MLVFKITQTSWINLFRSNLFALIIYTYVINNRERITINSLKYPLLVINLLNYWVLFTNWSSGFTHHSLESSYFNLNNIGFISLLIMLMSIIMVLKEARLSYWNYGNIALSFILVILSFSRSNYLLLAFTVIFIIIFIFNLKNNVKFLLIGTCLFSLLLPQITDSDILSFGFSFLDKKVNVGTPNEIFLGRLNDIAIHPIESYLADKPLIYLFFGGKLIPEHSLLITHLTCFGILSMFIYLQITFNTIKQITHKDASIKLVALLMLLLFLNDSSTNASTYIAFVKLIPFAFYGLIVGENNGKYRKVRW